ncbi:MAG: helix-turn-helix domain-containing protein [Polaromonas sp.]|nr:helix-turn-helix domain-containing protein [Polaromonas sp.]
MSEQDFLPPGRAESGAGPNSVAPGSDATAGGLLRQARQAQGLHLAALAAALKVPVHKLEALEQDRFDLLLDAVFVRALASGMCRLLKLDPEPILARLPSASTVKAPPQNWGINEPFRGRSTGLGSFFPAQLSTPVILVGLALLLGAAALIFLPAMQQEKGGKQAADPGVSAGASSAVQDAAGNSQPAVSANPPEMVVLPASAAAAASAPVPAALPASAPASAPVLPVTTGSASDTSIATFSATKASWVKVTDAKGVAVLGRTLQPGESANVSGTLPFSVVIGRADAIQVQVRGQAFDVNAVAKNNVARFEVK